MYKRVRAYIVDESKEQKTIIKSTALYKYYYYYYNYTNLYSTKKRFAESPSIGVAYWFSIDDLTNGGHFDIITKDVELIEREAALLGLQLNEAKCEIICPNDSSATHKPEFPDFISTPVHEMRLLGAPVMPGGEVTNVLRDKTDDLNRAVSRLAMLQSQDALIIYY